MAKIQRNFIKGRMNKSLDERLIIDGEYIDALNVRLGSTEDSEYGSVENTKGNTVLTSLIFTDRVTLVETPLSSAARTLGAYDDGANETIYWFVHDPEFPLGNTGKCDMIVSFNTITTQLNYHVISLDDGGGILTTLNFNPQNLITGINLIENLLFFTDNLNPPRSININNNYGDPVTGTPASVPSLAWKFTAGFTNAVLVDVYGFHRGTLLPCPNPIGGIGAGVAPTTTQIALPGTDCYTIPISGSVLTVTKGYGLQGSGNASNFALTSFVYGDSTGGFGIINSSGVGNPGSGTLSGTITGDDGSSGTWSVNYAPGSIFNDGSGINIQPESTGLVNFTSITLVNNVTYTINI